MCDRNSLEMPDKLSTGDKVPLSGNLSLSDSDSEEDISNVPFDSEIMDSDDEDEGPQLSCAPERPAAGHEATQSPFSLKGGSSGFSSRSRNIFDCLDSAAKVTSAQLGQDNVIDGVFARPPPPPPLGNSKKPGERTGQAPPKSRRDEAGGQGGKKGVPDYLVHPERWTCYSLEDVAETSNSQNSKVAQEFLHSLQQRKEQKPPGPAEDAFTPAFNQGQDNSGCNSSQQKILFTKPSRPDRTLKASGDTSRGRGFSHLEEMVDDEEEEEVGMVMSRALGTGMRRSKQKEVEKTKERKKCFSHIDQEEEEEEEEAWGAVKAPKEKERKRKWEQEGREEKEGISPGFVSFKKTNHKNYRKISDHDED